MPFRTTTPNSETDLALEAHRSFLIIQTAFTGDVILATALIEKIHAFFPGSPIDFLVRKGNEALLTGHPFLRSVLVWDKKAKKIPNLLRMIRKVRSARYDEVINVHRFASSGLITVFSRARHTTGFTKNPFSFLFGTRIRHVIGNGTHEVDRNQKLIERLTDNKAAHPRLYPLPEHVKAVGKYSPAGEAYCCVAPTSVWFTKQFPQAKWLEILAAPRLRPMAIFLLGAPADFELADQLREKSAHPNVVNLAGKLSYLESAALMKGAVMNFVNDSAPMHLASAMNAPVTAIYCSTVPEFGFGPLSDVRYTAETPEKLSCRPCGLHGYRACPQGHFKCATTILAADVLNGL